MGLVGFVGQYYLFRRHTHACLPHLQVSTTTDFWMTKMKTVHGPRRTLVTAAVSLAALMNASVGSTAESEPKSVEQILSKTPFQVVTLDQYKTRTKTGKVVGFFYDNGNVSGADGWRARNFRDSVEPGMAITFLALPYNRAVPDAEYLGLEFNKAPEYHFFHNGKKVFSHSGGQASPTPAEYAKDTEILRNNLRLLNGLR